MCPSCKKLNNICNKKERLLHNIQIKMSTIVTQRETPKLDR